MYKQRILFYINIFVLWILLKNWSIGGYISISINLLRDLQWRSPRNIFGRGLTLAAVPRYGDTAKPSWSVRSRL